MFSSLREILKSVEIVLAWLRGRSRDFEKEGALYVGHHGWPIKKILGFRWSKKAKITLNNKLNLLAKHFFQFFQIFSIFTYNESLPMKFYQFFKIYKRCYKKREKQSYSSQWERKNWEKLEIVWFNRLFYEALENGN